MPRKQKMADLSQFIEWETVVVVENLSRSPVMIVQEVIDEKTILCFWFDKNRLIHRDKFHPKCLKICKKFLAQFIGALME